MSVDPLMASAATGEPQSWNRYVYVSNNPLNLTDPTGMLQKPPVVSTITADDVRSDSQTLDGADDAPPQEPVQLPVVPKLDPHTKAPPQKRTFGDNEDNSPYAFQFSLGLLPPPPSQGPLPANSSASQVGSETRTPNLIETEAVITILDERNNRLASDGETFIVSEIIAEVTVSADLSQAAPEIGKPRFVLPDGTVNDVHTLRPRSGVRQFSESTYYLRRQIITVENSNTNKKYVVGYFLLETTATGLVITNCNRGCP